MKSTVRAMLAVTALVCLLAPARAGAQEGKLAAEFRREGERLAENCGELTAKALFGCAATLVTDHPVHVAFGSIAPQNGFGFGAAFVAPQWKPNDDWRINWSADAIGAPTDAWRAGAYAKFVNAAVPPITPTRPGGGTPSTTSTIRPYPVLSTYVQAISLPRLSFYGLGPSTSRAGRVSFRMRESIVGTQAIWPLARRGALQPLNLVAVGEVNGRFVDVSGSSWDAPSIETRYTEATAPGLSDQPATVQFGEGLRILPSLGNGLLRLNYFVNIQQFVAASSTYSFRRWTVDLRHEIPLSRNVVEPRVRDVNSPNDCATSVNRTTGEYGCPDPLVVSHNRTGTIGVRLLVSRSGVSGTSVVPFYFQQTLGGSDINGSPMLASYDDYRFRGPHLLLLQETFEHSVWGPLGLFLAGEHGRVALQGESLGFNRLKHSFAAGLTLRAGGVPMITLSWAQGGSEGHHIAATMSTSLFGGGGRPSLH